MIEDGLFAALGFCTAVVLALALLPLLWARALRLTKQRLELLVPWSRDEIDAERDGLRAQAAVEQRRLEQDSERSRAALARRDIDLGQRTVELARGEMDREILEGKRAALAAELAGEHRDRLDAEGQRFAVEKALHDADRRTETDAVAALEQSARHAALFQLAEERRGTVAALETRVAGLVATAEDRDDALAQRAAEVADARLVHAELTDRHRQLGTAHDALVQAHAEAEHALADARTQAAERDQRLQRRAASLTAAEIRIGEQDAAMKHKDDRLAGLQARFDTLMADLAARREADADADERESRLRNAIVAAGDDALRLLGPELEAEDGASATVKERP